MIASVHVDHVEKRKLVFQLSNHNMVHDILHELTNWAIKNNSFETIQFTLNWVIKNL